ncbi:helix-turn-helix domain-containing protein [Paenibacillus sp. 1P07SE]|uniref:helix-turn-helix domain-containing protein n=1 Tax=Paenibacillus sp. 1P07SE TaxID=3132209 RepID=UPI0039A3FF01
MTRQWFNRLLLSYLPMFFVFASFLILITFLLINQYSQAETRKASEVYVRHVLQMIDSTLKPLDQMIVNGLQSDEKLLDYFKFPAGNEYLVEFEASNRLKELAQTSALIDSIYLYRYDDRHVLTHNFKVPLDQFGDDAFVETVAGEGYRPSGWTERRAYKKFKDQEAATEVTSLVRRVPLLSGEQGLLVLNVRLDGLRRYVEDMSEAPLSYLYMLDQSGAMMLQAGGQYEPPPDSSMELAMAESAYTGWAIHSGIRNKPFFDFVSIFSYAWIVAQLGIVILGIGWIIYVTRRNYKPIELIMSSIHHYFEKKSHLFVHRGKLDEFSFIETALKKIMEQSGEESDYQGEHLRMKRRQWLQELADGREWTEPGPQEDLDAMGSGIFFIIELDQISLFKERYSRSDQNLLKYVLRNVVQESAELQQREIWAEWTGDSRLSVLYHLEVTDAETSAELLSFCEPIRQWVEQHLDMTITIGIGSPALTPSGLKQSYAEAVEALKLKLIQGSNRTLVFERAEGKLLDKEAVQGLSAIHAIAQCFRAGDKLWRDKLERLFIDLKNGEFSYEEIHHVIHYLIYHLHGEMSGLPEDYRALWKKEIFPRLKEGVEASDTLDLLQASLLHQLSLMADHLQELRQRSSHTSLIQEIQRYIDEHYYNAELSLAFLSATFGINSNYLSRLFKESTGHNFVDYLIQVRMEHAKRLLAEKADSVQQIAEQVGYTHAVSFIRIFKRTVGVTPGDYRKKHSLTDAI